MVNILELAFANFLEKLVFTLRSERIVSLEKDIKKDS